MSDACRIENGLVTVQETVARCFPDYWNAVETGLSVCATLLLEDIVNCTALILVGPPSAGKTTVAEMFTGAKVNGKNLCYVSDSFTSASFVSHAATVKREDLDKIDLLERIKHKVLITPELSLTFRGKKEEDLTKHFSTITRVLDGQGYQTDSGTHGQRGKRGDYSFAWLGCTTPFEDNVWRVMAQLGSRLLFLLLDTSTTTDETSLVMGLGKVNPYRVRLEECKQGVGTFLGDLFSTSGGVRGVKWDSAANPEAVKQWIARFAQLLARMRGVRTGKGREEAPSYESPQRAATVFYNLARGHALIHGRRVLSEEDVPMLAHLAASSMPTERSRVFRALVQAKDGELTTGLVKSVLGVKTLGTARQVMEDLAHLGLVAYAKGNGEESGFIRFQAQWTWCHSQEFVRMLSDHPRC